ncbi:peroxidase [Rosistilla carotiformis]|uniref:Peroxidase n=1 Tax=Rosistilla carotiformis TaxID=2528017 RepID=A0A518JWJ5_9BACT|nr:peroxidase family protein [Rosistilla carotiformis]QDV69917.1 peroxidase [Rosistilla carotiformis]
MQDSHTSGQATHSWIKRAAGLFAAANTHPRNGSQSDVRHDFRIETLEPLIVLSASSMCGAAVSDILNVDHPEANEYAPPDADDTDPSETPATVHRFEETNGDGESDLFDHAPTSPTTDPPALDLTTTNASEFTSQLVQDLENLLREVRDDLLTSATGKDVQIVLAPTINIVGDNNHLTIQFNVDATGAHQITSGGDGDLPTLPADPTNPAPPIDSPTDDSVATFSDDFRTIDGTENNLQNGTGFGATGSTLVRLAPADYADGLEAPAGADRSSAREISNLVNDQETSMRNEEGITDFLWLWGQFIDHDIDLSQVDSGESFPITVPKGDPYFDPDGTGTAEIPLTRSEYELDANGTRQQYNVLTAFIDASQVYGSDTESQMRLRSFEGGQLDMPENLLPTEIDARGQKSFYAGDERVGENIALSSMHTLFAREHNRIATDLAATEYHDRDLSDAAVDEEIYQRARAIVGAELQHITYHEFLPTLLGEGALSAYTGYDATVDPSVATEFSTAAFRFGHTTLSPQLLRLDAAGKEIAAGHVSLRDAFFATDTLIESGIDPILQGAAANVSQTIDPYIIDDIRNFLFGAPGEGGMDLASLNIQRGRDHGLSSYNDTRESLGLDRFECFEQVSSDPEIVARLKSAYESIDDIDLWVGGLSEDHAGDGNLGETFRTIIVDQFERLRDGDRYWYETALSASDLAMVKETQLSDIIRQNTTADTVQDNVFVLPNHGTSYV